MFIPQSFEDQLLRQDAALAQNPGFKGAIEVPTDTVATEARAALARLGIENITVRVVPLPK